MKTRLTETLGVEHPVMLAGMGGVYPTRPWSPRCRRPAASAASAPPPMSNERMVAEIAEVQGGDRQALRGRPAHRHARRPRGVRWGQIIEGGASVFVAGLGRAGRGGRDLPPPRDGAARDQHVRQGRARPAGASRPDVTSWWPREQRPGATPAWSPPCRWCPRSSTPWAPRSPWWRPGGIFDGRGARRRAGARGRRLYRRFFGPKRGFTEKETDFYVNVDFVAHVALVAVVDESGKETIIGAGRYIVAETGKAELALAIIDEYQGRGIGTALLRHLVSIARKNGLQQLVAEVLAEMAPC